MQEQITEKKLKLYVIDAYKVARESGMGRQINTIMQVCFFAISGVLPKDEAIASIKYSIKKTYGKRGEVVLERNFAAVDGALRALHEVIVPTRTRISDPGPLATNGRRTRDDGARGGTGVAATVVPGLRLFREHTAL